MLTEGAIYRFARTDNLRYYRAARTQAGVDFLYPINVSGTRIADRNKSGRRYVILYFMSRWNKLAAVGYWLDPKQAFEQAYVTDATEEDLELITEDLEELPQIDAALDNILNRHEIEVDVEVWGLLLDDQ
jgi:hypothetical protein